MLDIFVSRPTWIAEEFKEGLKNFLSFLETLELKPRTLGATDYPTESPLDEVISIMNECKGVIILGYPQIVVEKGHIKDDEVSNLLLPTEWNHIEAGLAYAKRMPLLVIHHKGVKRGIFDRGAINKFIYEIYLDKEGWVLSAEIKGALQKWKAAVMSYENKVEGTAQKELASPDHRLKKEIESVLVYLFKNTDDSSRHVEAVARTFGVDRETAMYLLDELVKRRMIRMSRGNFLSGQSYYSLTPGGREYVIRNKLEN